MTVLEQGIQTGEWLLSEAEVGRSRDVATVTVAGAVALASGTVLGSLTTGTAAAVAKSGNTGNGTMGAITVSSPARAGAYKLTIIEPAANGGVFEVEDPDGVPLKPGAIAAAYSDGGLAFTLADGATDFVSGDQFTITVTVTATKYVKHSAAATDGSQIARAVLYNALAGVNGDYQATIISTDAQVIGAMLNGGAGLAASGVADLLKVGIKVR